MEIAHQPTKKSKLTLYILIAMVLGIVAGYYINQNAAGNKISYSPAKDYTGKDSFGLSISGSQYFQKVLVVKDSASYRNLKDSIPKGTWLVVSNTNKSYIPAELTENRKIDRVSAAPSHGTVSIVALNEIADFLKLLTTIFLRMVQMIIAPIVFATLVVGIAKLGDMKTVGRVGGKAMLWFITASLVSLGLGLLLVNIFKPGVGVDINSTDMAAVNDLLEKSKGFSLQKFVEHVVPKSVVEAMATNEILQLVVFSVFFGIALTAIGKKGEPIVNALDSLAHVVLKMVTYVMYLAPLGVFGAMAAAIAKNGLGILVTFGFYVGEFYLGLAILWAVLLLVGYLFLKHRLRILLRRIATPMSIAFSTASSEAVYPKLVEEMERFGCNNKIVSFVLPLGYSFNLDGSMMYMTFASMFIAQAFGITSLTGDVGQQVLMLLVFLITSKGIAGVPRASLVVVLATGAMFGLPPEGVGLILAIDVFCDMGRTMTNVLGNALATAAVAKWEGQLETP
ncbi:MAG TPA: dicarboxylate/amino acid:cation symporter [Ferruginibacter sp.]|nr:dicarboxylate/amino acid:cation symporter [Ferruginibacter sp.]